MHRNLTENPINFGCVFYEKSCLGVNSASEWVILI